MRVVAGTAKGRRLAAPSGRTVRPTSDRVREAAFNALASLSVIEGARVVDLFAGSGALGIEALSRGAASAVFVEPDRDARVAVSANLKTLGFDDPERARVLSCTAEVHLGSTTPDSYDLAVIDPPYAFDGWPELFASLGAVMAPEGVVVVESDRAIEPAEVGPSGWEILREKRYGGTVLSINVRTAV